jgi:hypothetical protein
MKGRLVAASCDQNQKTLRTLSFTSPQVFCTLPASLSAALQIWVRRLPVALPAACSTEPFICLAMPAT